MNINNNIMKEEEALLTNQDLKRCKSNSSFTAGIIDYDSHYIDDPDSDTFSFDASSMSGKPYPRHTAAAHGHGHNSHGQGSQPANSNSSVNSNGGTSTNTNSTTTTSNTPFYHNAYNHNSHTMRGHPHYSPPPPHHHHHGHHHPGCYPYYPQPGPSYGMILLITLSVVSFVEIARTVYTQNQYTFQHQNYYGYANYGTNKGNTRFRNPNIRNRGGYYMNTPLAVEGAEGDATLQDPDLVLPVDDLAIQQQQQQGGVDETNIMIESIPSTTDSISSSSLQRLNYFKNNWDEWEPSDIPVFFHIPKAGGSTVKDIIGSCHRFVMATEFGVTDGHATDSEIAIVYPGGGPAGQDRSPFVNVDTTTVSGIERAQSMGFADSGLADAVVTPFIYEANQLFTPTAKGRLFTVFRHPIDRAISLFYYLQVATWEPTYDPELINWTLEQYAQSDRVENNWLTRQLSNQLGGDLTDEHLTIALETIRDKFFVGLMTEISETMERFERFFRWRYKVNPPNQEACRERLLSGGSNSNASHKSSDKPQPGSEVWSLLEAQNIYDLQVYAYIEVLFQEQAAFVVDIPPDFRNIDATCCKCDPPTFPPEGFECPKNIPF